MYRVIILIAPEPPVAERKKSIIMNSGKVLLGLLAGVAVGATLGILFAPDKGSATRKKITKKGEDYVDALNEKFSDMVGGIKEKFDSVKEETSRMAHNGNARAEDGRTESKNSGK